MPTTIRPPANPTYPEGAANREFVESLRKQRGRLVVVGDWFQNNVAASQTNAVLNRAGWVADGVAFSTSRWVAPRPGAVVGLFVKSSEAWTGGVLTVQLTINGTAAGSVTVKLSTTTRGTYQYKEFPGDTVRFKGGDGLGLVVTTDGSWTPTTADIVAGLELLLD